MCRGARATFLNEMVLFVPGGGGGGGGEHDMIHGVACNQAA